MMRGVEALLFRCADTTTDVQVRTFDGVDSIGLGIFQREVEFSTLLALTAEKLTNASLFQRDRAF